MTYLLVTYPTTTYSDSLLADNKMFVVAKFYGFPNENAVVNYMLGTNELRQIILAKMRYSYNENPSGNDILLCWNGRDHRLGVDLIRDDERLYKITESMGLIEDWSPVSIINYANIN